MGATTRDFWETGLKLELCGSGGRLLFTKVFFQHRENLFAINMIFRQLMKAERTFFVTVACQKEVKNYYSRNLFQFLLINPQLPPSEPSYRNALCVS